MSSARSFADDAQNALPLILSLSGEKLTTDERALFKSANPLGFILFARNCETADQIRALTEELKSILGRDCPILIDQEGGRVQRLKPPYWRSYEPALSFAKQAETNLDEALEALRFQTLQISQDLSELGINVDCAPVLDVLFPETHDVIGDRAYGTDPALIGRLGLSVCRQFLAAGITPVIKHIPGHGRATLDSHKDLPRVKASLDELISTDFAPFHIVASAECAPALWGMSAHVIYEAIDPDHPATVSEKVISEIIRDHIGFDGFLLGDDLDMEALGAYGDATARAQLSLKAGCDAALYCAGDFTVMDKLAENLPSLGAKSLERLKKSAGYATLAA